MTQAAGNPFFGKFKTPFETPPFDQIKTEHYEPAFDEGIRRMEKEIKAIAENPSKNYSEIAKMCGVSRQRVSKIRESARAYYKKKVMKNGQTKEQ